MWDSGFNFSISCSFEEKDGENNSVVPDLDLWEILDQPLIMSDLVSLYIYRSNY